MRPEGPQEQGSSIPQIPFIKLHIVSLKKNPEFILK
jgi:hypothetical protein